MKLIDPIRYVKLKASGRLPSPKGVALAIIRLLQNDDYKIDDLVRMIQSDPALAGELLKFSNAASYGHSRPVVSLSKAISTLGTNRVRVIVIAFSVLHNHRCGNCPEFDYEQFWARSLATAIAAQEVATFAKINPEENFTAGLLCSLGELALASIFPDRYGKVMSSSNNNLQQQLELEREAFGNDHLELNSTLLLDWGLPEVLVTAIYHCEAPDEAGFQDGSRIYGLTLSLNLALAMAKICVADDSARWSMLPNLYAKAARLGISTEEMNVKADKITSTWIDWGKLLKIQTREIVSFAQLLASSPPREQVSSTLCNWPADKSLLLVCNESAEATTIISYLETNGYAVKHASTSREGILMALEHKPVLIMIEMSAPDIDGVKFCNTLRETPFGQSTFVIFLVSQADDGLLAQALDMGADDLLLRPITGFSLKEKLRGAFKIIQLQQDLIKERNGLVDSAGEWAGANRRLTQVAMTDPLTKLANRRHGMDFLSNEWAYARSNNLPLSCLMVDVDHFKKINDKYGHKAGDSVLFELATILQTSARSSDLAFRYGGEEFCLICPGVNLITACIIAERIRQDVENRPFLLENREVEVTVSIGVSIMLPGHTNEEALIHDADEAMYSAKNAGRNRIVSSPNLWQLRSIK